MVGVAKVCAVEFDKTKANVYPYPCIKVSSSDISRYLAEIGRGGGSRAYDKENVTVRFKLNNGQIVDAKCPLEKLGNGCERALEKKKGNVYKSSRFEYHHVGRNEVRIVVDTEHIRDGLKGMGEAVGRSFERAVNIDSKPFADVCDKAVDEFVGVCDRTVDKITNVCYHAIYCTLIVSSLWAIVAYKYLFQVQADCDRSTC